LAFAAGPLLRPSAMFSMKKREGQRFGRVPANIQIFPRHGGMGKGTDRRNSGAGCRDSRRFGPALKKYRLFFDGWLDKFEKENTREDSFKKADGENVVCEFMNRTMGSHGFRKGKNFTMFSMTLKNGTVEFYLPDEGVDAHGFFEDPNTLYEVMEGRMAQEWGRQPGK